jgi:glycosyltransferase involved in cell wall biosynthesis
MRLLISTQVVDPSNTALGFFVDWIYAFREHCLSVTVLSLEQSDQKIEGVVLKNLGKLKGSSGSFKLVYIFRLIFTLYKERNTFDVWFVHMNPEYVALAGLFVRFVLKKKIVLWYTHKSKSVALRIALPFVNTVFSALQGSFPLNTKKLITTGHAIDVNSLLCIDRSERKLLNYTALGRIAASKHTSELIKVIGEFQKFEPQATLEIVGKPTNAQESAYFKIYVEPYLSQKGIVQHAVAHSEIGTVFQRTDLLLHMSSTGGLDKSVLEAFSTCTLVLSNCSNFKAVLEPLGFFVQGVDVSSWIQALQRVSMITPLERERLGKQLREYTIRHHSMQATIAHICTTMEHI